MKFLFYLPRHLFFVSGFFLWIGFPFTVKLDALPITPNPKEIKRVLFLGNSITYNGKYIKDIETYYRFNHPERETEFINVGLPSETVSGLSEPGHANGDFPRPDLHERLERVLELLKPDLVFACYGMNDGIYLPFDQSRFKKFKDGTLRLHEQVFAAGADIVHLTPPVYDEQNGGSPGYDKVLEKYGDWLLSMGKEEKWKVVDIHGPMKKFLTEKRRWDPTYTFSADGIHPDATGHWLMAKQILLFLGEEKMAGAAGINEALEGKPNVNQVIELVEERQDLTRDSWLSATGHKRPGLRDGLPLDQALAKGATMAGQIQNLIK